MKKYKVYADYVFTVEVGEYEANSREEAIEKAENDIDGQHTLCYHCSHKILDHPQLLDDGITAEEVSNE